MPEIQFPDDAPPLIGPDGERVMLEHGKPDDPTVIVFQREMVSEIRMDDDTLKVTLR